MINSSLQNISKNVLLSTSYAWADLFWVTSWSSHPFKILIISCIYSQYSLSKCAPKFVTYLSFIHYMEASSITYVLPEPFTNTWYWKYQNVNALVTLVEHWPWYIIEYTIKTIHFLSNIIHSGYPMWF